MAYSLPLWRETDRKRRLFAPEPEAFLKLLKSMTFPEHFPEDLRICMDHGPLLKYLGMRFAPMHIAYLFSIENEPYRGSFGWHGRYMPPVDLE